MIDMTHVTPELMTAYSKAQASLRNATKDSNNPQFKTKYASLAGILTLVRDAFTEQEMSFIQSAHFDGTLVTCSTIVMHSKGGYIESSTSCVPKSPTPQGIGDSTTYLRRYSLASVAGIHQEDDDGNSQSAAVIAPVIAKISPADVVEIKTDLEKTGSDVPRFLKLFQVKNVEDISTIQLDQVKKLLAKKIKEVSHVE